jgi:hypothetical protein
LSVPFAPSVGLTSGLTIQAEPPTIKPETLQTRVDPEASVSGQAVNKLTIQITLLSTLREVSELTMTFNTTPTIRLSCGSVAGCTTLGNSMTFQVRNLFDEFFATTTSSLATLNLPLRISGDVHGSVTITFRNRQGFSNAITVNLP